MDIVLLLLILLWVPVVVGWFTACCIYGLTICLFAFIVDLQCLFRLMLLVLLLLVDVFV